LSGKAVAAAAKPARTSVQKLPPNAAATSSKRLGVSATSAIGITAPRAATKTTPTAAKAAAGKPPMSNGANAPNRLSKPATVSPAGKMMTKTPTRQYASIADLPEDYRPSDDEPFMYPIHQAYFRAKLQKWKDDIVRETMETLQVLHADTQQHPDLADRATHETDRALDLRARDRQRKLVSKIDSALRRISDGSYGYCADTGEPISLKRLDARPVATLSLEAQERHERRERVYRDE
jgi:DnaK suppressor protein